MQYSVVRFRGVSVSKFVSPPRIKYGAKSGRSSVQGFRWQDPRGVVKFVKKALLLSRQAPAQVLLSEILVLENYASIQYSKW